MEFTRKRERHCCERISKGGCKAAAQAGNGSPADEDPFLRRNRDGAINRSAIDKTG